VLVGATTISVDIRRPVLDWNHPQQAVKQNMNVLTGMGLAIVSVVGVAAPAVGTALLGASVWLVLAAAAVVAAIAAVIVLRTVRRYADRRYSVALDD
jgi:ABC-2 type transport system permease protein